MNKIEQVAKAINSSYPHDCGIKDCSHCKCLNTVVLNNAKAAITAMREPTDKMLDGARNWSVSKHGRGVGNVDATQCFQAMIDAALK